MGSDARGWHVLPLSLILVLCALASAAPSGAPQGIRLWDFAFVEVVGRPGHEGYFPIQASPVQGLPTVARVNLFGPVAEAEVRFVSGSGAVLAAFPVIRPSGSSADSPTFYGNVTVPRGPFQILVRGLDTAGNSFSATLAGQTITPQTLRLALVSTPSTLIPNIPGLFFARLENYGAPDTFTVTLTDNVGGRTVPGQAQVNLSTGGSALLNISATLLPNPDPLADYVLTVAATGTVPEAGNRAVLKLPVAAESGRRISVDVMPGSCVNPIQVSSKGVTTVAIFSSADFDPQTLDARSIYLAGSLRPQRITTEDVSSPGACDASVRDGRPDLVLHFDTQTLATTLVSTTSALLRGERRTVPVMLSAVTLEGVECGGYDLVRLQN